jgi:glycopeptide antibiotics resistance protein
LSLLALYGIAIMALTFFPVRVSAEYREFLTGIDATPRHNVIPLATLQATASAGPRVLAYQVGGNAVMLAPFSMLVAALWPHRSSLRSIVALGFAVTLTIEVAQLGFSSLLGVEYKSFDVDDVLLNIAGVALGWCIWRGLDRWFGSRDWWTDTLRWLRGRRAEHRSASGR